MSISRKASQADWRATVGHPSSGLRALADAAGHRDARTMGRRSAKCGWRLGLAVAVLVGLIEMMFTLVSCSGVSAGGGGTLPAVNPATHRANVTGTSPGTSTDAAQSVVVTLVVD